MSNLRAPEKTTSRDGPQRARGVIAVAAKYTSAQPSLGRSEPPLA